MEKNKYTSNERINYGIYFLILCISVMFNPLYSAKHILTAAQQNMLTPGQVLQDLIDGNKRFYSKSALKRRSAVALSRKASKHGQFPKAVILACMDSRSIPEIIFDQSIADIFTLRVAGNVVNDDMLASMEYATQYVGSKVIVVMGHTQCGAIKAACGGTASSDNLASLIATIKPAVTMVKDEMPDKELDCSNAEVIKNITLQNVRNMIKRVIKDSKIIQELLTKGSIKVVGALHDIASGVVTFEEATDWKKFV